MSASRFPNVFYIGAMAPGMVFDPTHLALWKLADTRTFWVSDDRLDRLRSYFVRKQQRLPNSSKKPLSGALNGQVSLPYKTSLMLHNSMQHLDVSKLTKIKVKPDLIFVTEVYRKLEHLKSIACPKAFYVQDPHMGIKRYLDLAHVQDYDYVFVRQKDYIPALEEGGCQRVFWIPETFDPDTILGPSGAREITVTFIGNRYPGTAREKMLVMLEKEFHAINSLVYLKEMASILRQSKIVFNVSRAGDLNNRVFDAMGAGALLVTERIQNGLFDLFEDRVHLVSYDGVKELEEMVRYYLKNDEERQKIANAGQQEVMAKHTNLDRANTILEICLDKDLLADVHGRYQGLKQQLLLGASSRAREG